MDKLVQTFSGGSAKVEIFQQQSGLLYAKKTLTKPELARRFKREVEYQGRFTHRNIVPVYESHLDEDPPYYMMPYAPYTLFEYPKPTPASFIFDVLIGLEAIHDQGYAHRDLKPQNILIFLAGNGEYFAAISDFGLLDVPESSNTSQLTLTGMWGGTQSYSAPECFVDLKSVGYRADFYSLGAILYDTYINKPRVPCAQLTAEGAIGSVIQRCTYFDPELRYSSVLELRDAFQIAIAGSSDDMLRQPAATILQSLNDGTPINISEIIKNVDILSSDPLYREAFIKHLTPQIIYSIKTISDSHFNKLLSNFCTYISENGFSFSYCDSLADRAKVFFQNSNEDGQALVAAAVLELGVSHNRFYVEDLFFKLAGPHISNSLALKIKNAAIRLGIDLSTRIAQCSSSLRRDATNVHKLLLEKNAV